jgi:penicillin-binding protein 1C
VDRQAPLVGPLVGRRLLGVALAINIAWLVLIGAVYAVPLPSRELGWSTSVEYRDGDPAYVFLAPDDKWRLPVELDRVDPKYVEALVALEDKRFYSHAGVDPIAIVRATWSDVTRMRRVSGGSTLSMQLARLLEPRARTIPNKVIDMFRALQLDARLSKRRILEQYLARTPYGRNVEGIESAAWSYFGHSARHLSPVEISTLLAVPQGPARFAPNAANAERLRERRDAILEKLIAAGVFSSADTIAAREEARDVAPPAKLRPMPRQAMHAALWLRAQAPTEIRIRSTLDRGAQALVEKDLALRADELKYKAIKNQAVVVVDHRTREVVALASTGTQIAMFAKPRSPGSTLKPMLYALAIDRGLALPEYLVADVPMTFGTYHPHNFDNDFAGLITLREALSRSLNVPFVVLLNQLGVETFVGELERTGVSHKRARPGELGLSLIAGGMETTPLELAGLYATLAEAGVYQPLRVRPDDPIVPPAAIYGPAAAYLTREALSLRDRPDFPKRRDASAMPAQIHWKTGTSFGYRDAWAVGSGPAYTAVVWTGNVDMRGSHELVGSEAAGPLLFDVLEGLADKKDVLAGPPADLIDVEVCAYSGHIATDACTHRIKVKANVHAVPTEPCPYHQQCGVVFPSEVTAWLVERHRAVPESACAVDADPPSIVLPAEGQTVMLIPGMPASQQQIPLQASTRSPTVSWFVDGLLVGTTSSRERLFWAPTPGSHQVVVEDETGKKAKRTIVVR